jgi:hypothetical protein
VPAVNINFPHQRRAERFAELLDETSGRRHHSHGTADEQLAELVAIGHRLSATPIRVQAEPDFRVDLRAMLVAAAERDGIGAAAVSAVETEPGTHSGVRRSLSSSGRRIRARSAIVIGVAAGAMAVSGISAASENASPGDALYGVKRSTERAQLAMAGSDDTRGQLSLDFARTRLAEAAAMRGDDPAFGRVLNDMDADTKKGVRLLTGSAVTRSQPAELTTVDGFVNRQRHTLQPVLEKLSPANEERALESVALLDDVHDRTTSLRAGLACPTRVRVGADALGPKLKNCLYGTDDATSTDRPRGTAGKTATKPGGSAVTGKTKPERTTPAADPGATGPADRSTGTAADPDDTDPDTGGSTQTPTPTIDDDEDGFLDGVVGGIGGILGR